MSDSELQDVRIRAAVVLESQQQGAPARRSCWVCNVAHEYLKHADYVFTCFVCGRWYFEGCDITHGENRL